MAHLKTRTKNEKNTKPTVELPWTKDMPFDAKTASEKTGQGTFRREHFTRCSIYDHGLWVWCYALYCLSGCPILDVGVWKLSQKPRVRGVYEHVTIQDHLNADDHRIFSVSSFVRCIICSFFTSESLSLCVVLCRLMNDMPEILVDGHVNFSHRHGHIVNDVGT